MNHFENYLWLTPDADAASPVITRSFSFHGGNAVMDVTGLGYYELRVNGKKVGNDRFAPLVTDYFRRDFTEITYPCRDTFTHRICYNTYDITPYLTDGENRLEIQLGNGYFVQNERIAEGKMGYSDRPVCHYRITLTDEAGTVSSVGSDGTEVWYLSEITDSNLFIGEIIDPAARKNAETRKVQIFPMPETELCPQKGTPDRVIRTITPVFLGSFGGKYVFDAGENVSGVVRLHTDLPRGTAVTPTFAEERNKDGTLDYDSTGSGYTGASGRRQIMTDVFVSDGSERDFEPKFVWHGFRYFDLAFSGTEVLPEELLQKVRAEVIVIHADNVVTSAFSSDNEGLDFLYGAYIRTQLDNMHGGFPMDCPHRERLGYTGDGQCCAAAAMLLLDSREFYGKWIRDIFDCQNKENGHIQHTAPFQGGGGGPGGWGSAVITVPYAYWKQYGETELLRENYPAMVKWFSYLKDHMENGLVVREEEGGWCLGDWCMLDSGKIPEAYVNTCYLVHTLRQMLEISDALGERKDVPAFRQLEKEALTALQNKLDEMRKDWEHSGNTGKGAALTYAVWLGIADIGELAAYYEALGHYDTGFLGTEILTGLLMENGYADLCVRLINADTVGGFLYMKRHGATTIWESWNGGGSHNHPMFGASAARLFSGILGIRQAEGSYGWDTVRITPYLPEGMNRASGSVSTPRGSINVSLERNPDGTVSKAVSVPDGITVI